MAKNLTGYARKCNECSSGMDEGFVIENGEEHYCTNHCLNKHYSTDEWNKMAEGDDADSYWTDWDDPFDIQYLDINGILTEIEIV